MSDFLKVPDSIKDDIINYLSGKLSKQQSESLLLWLNASDDRKKFFDIITDIWHSSATLSHTDKFEPNKAWEEIEFKLSNQDLENIAKPGRILSLVKSYYKIAAMIAIIMATGYGAMYLYFSGKTDANSTQYIEMVAPLGSRTFITLPDGTKVWLNSGSKLRFFKKYGTGTRDVNLDGEAYFVVAKNKDVPFVVHTSDIKITALGTAFNVKAYRDEPIIGTTLDEGSVKIESCLGNSGKNVPIILKPKQTATYSKVLTSVTIHVLSNVNGEKVMVAKQISIPPKQLRVIPNTDTKIFTSWKETRWIFRHETLGDLAKKLERKYDVTIAFKDESLKEYSFSGSLQDESIEQVLEVIRIIAPIKYTISHKTIELSTNKELKEKYERFFNSTNKEPNLNILD